MKKDNWILKAFLMTFFIALFFSGTSNLIVNKFDFLTLIILTIIIILIGIIFDMIGTAVLTASEPSFHAKSAKKIKGAKETIYLIKNQNKIASICNDVIGDICGIISGSLGAMISLNLNSILNINITIITLLVSSIISSLTVGGKAAGKKTAIKKSDNIIFIVGKVIYKFKRKK